MAKFWGFLIVLLLIAGIMAMLFLITRAMYIQATKQILGLFFPFVI
ncbi:MAG: hypothetical protein ACP5NZ_00560 [Nanobdellota archaeon]